MLIITQIVCSQETASQHDPRWDLGRWGREDYWGSLEQWQGDVIWQLQVPGQELP